eukprot:Selendium_serpulae@DN6311_c1_g1_i6.p1
MHFVVQLGALCDCSDRQRTQYHPEIVAQTAAAEWNLTKVENPGVVIGEPVATRRAAVPLQCAFEQLGGCVKLAVAAVSLDPVRKNIKHGTSGVYVSEIFISPINVASW